MKRGVVNVLLVVSLVFVLFLTVWKFPSAHADIGADIESGWASSVPTIDGHISLGEWADATVRNFALQMRYSDNSVNRTLQGTLYVKNNWTYAFLAIQIFNDDYESHDFGGHYKGFAVLFSDNDSGTLVVGDNGEGVTTWTGSPFYSNNDLYYTGSYWDSDVDASKTNDGSLAWSHTGAPTQGAIGNWTFEMAIPLVGSDGLAYDFNITSLPCTVGYKIWLQDPTPVGVSGVYPDNATIAPITQTTNAATFGDLTFYPLYNLTMVAGTGGTTNPSPGLHQYPYKTVVSATATADAWYEFDHWELDGINVGVANPYSVTMDQNHTLNAVFLPLYALNITTTTGGSTNPVPGVHVYQTGTVVPVSATSSAGYVFDHWELDTVDVGTGNPYSVLMNQNHTLNAVFVLQLSVTISPADSTINLGGSVPFTSVVTGGTPAYSYQWYVNSVKVPGATSASWTFTPASVGTYYVYVNVTDFRGRNAISNTARVIVVTTPVGGYSVSLEKSSSTPSIVFYSGVLTAFGAAISLLRRRKKYNIR